MSSYVGKQLTFPKDTCLICCEGEDDVDLGLFHDLQVFSVHYLCVLTGHDLYLTGSEVKQEGLLGFTLSDIYSGYHRFKRRMCVYCNKYGASVRCSKCNIRYHYPCGLRNGAIVKMLDAFIGDCKDCYLKSVTPIPELEKKVCVICFDNPKEKPHTRPFWPSCCKSASYIIDSDCLKDYAFNAGYLMKCPICSDKTTFTDAVLTFGVFIPRVDGNWMSDFKYTYVHYPLRCGAMACIVKEDMDVLNTIVLCLTCHARMSHKQCTFSGIFVCSRCSQRLFGVTCELNEAVTGVHKHFPWFDPLIEHIRSEGEQRTVLASLRTYLKKLLAKTENQLNWENVLTIQESNFLAKKLQARYAMLAEEVEVDSEDEVPGPAKKAKF